MEIKKLLERKIGEKKAKYRPVPTMGLACDSDMNVSACMTLHVHVRLYIRMCCMHSFQVEFFMNFLNQNTYTFVKFYP